jgi:hypothetical protein
MNDIEKAIKFLKAEKANVTFETDHRIPFYDLAIAALTQQLNNGWIPVTERLPENEERVLICADKKSINGKVIQIKTTAMYEDGTMHTEDSGYSWEDNDFEYCEETDDYIIPEGWYEQNMYCEEFGIVDDFVTHWMPLQQSQKEASYDRSN